MKFYGDDLNQKIFLLCYNRDEHHNDAERSGAHIWSTCGAT